MPFPHTFALLSGNVPASYLDANFNVCLQTTLNLSDLASAATARTNLGLGTMAVQNANAVAITGGTITGIVNTGGSFTGVTNLTIANGGTITPATNDGAGLGTTTLMWADLFLASGGVVNFNNGNYTLTHSAGNLVAAGGPFTAPSFIPSGSTVPSNGLYLPAANTLGLAVNSTGEVQLTATALSPITNDGSALGTTTLMWADVFLANGGVVNWNNGDVLITHSTDLLAFTGATNGYSFDTQIATPKVEFSASPATATSANSLNAFVQNTYTPTLTNGTNVAASTSAVCRYFRVGDQVVVSGRILVDPTAATTATELGVSLPVASNFALQTDAHGVGVSSTGETWEIVADAANNRLSFNAVSNTTANHGVTFTAQYLVI